jgi:hypothetical protein
LQAASGATVDLADAAIGHLYLYGPGVFDTSTAGTDFSGTTITPSATIEADSTADSFSNVTLGGYLSIASGASATMTNFNVISSGQLDILAGGTGYIDNFQSVGRLSAAEC